MTNREPAMRRSQNPSSHQSIEDAPPMMRRIGGSALSPNVWTQRSTPLARMILSLGSIGRISGPGVGGCFGTWALSLFVMTVRSFLNGCSIVYSEHTAIVLRPTIDPSLWKDVAGWKGWVGAHTKTVPHHESVPTRL